MFANYAELLRLVSCAGGTVQGRKRFQKLVYLAQQKGWPFTETFRYVLNGPFSEQLAGEIEEMRAFRFLAESRQEGRGYLPCYSLSEEGQRLTHRIPPRLLPDGMADFVATVNARETRILELLATAHFLTRCGYGKDEVVRMIMDFGPHRAYSVEEIQEAFLFLGMEGLVSLT